MVLVRAEQQAEEHDRADQLPELLNRGLPRLPVLVSIRGVVAVLVMVVVGGLLSVHSVAVSAVHVGAMFSPTAPRAGGTWRLWSPQSIVRLLNLAKLFGSLCATVIPVWVVLLG